MPAPIMGAFIAAIITLLGFLIHIWHDRRKQWNVSSEIFRSAFFPAITRVQSNPWNLKMILLEEFDVHHKAVLAFRPHLRRRVSEFDEAWQSYEAYARVQKPHSPDEAHIADVLCVKRADNEGRATEVLEIRKNEWLAHINRLLEFAAPK